jgi:hypothetical protein
MNSLCKINRTFIPMTGIIMLMLACIPKEDPVDTLVLSNVTGLPELLQENSGMTELGDLIWFISDGGNEPALYGYSLEQDSVLRKVIVDGVSNVDWEDITQNGQQVFIGDFGNNMGTRTDLHLIVVNKTELLAAQDTVTPAGIINFSYSDQDDFTPSLEDTPFDCEAFIATDDSVYLFTKDWKNLQTRVYSLATDPGTQTAKLRKQWNVSGLITAAGWSPVGNELYLLGYTPLYPFIWQYTGFSPDDLSFTGSLRSDFTDFWGTQTEGILLHSDGSVYVSSESSPVNDASLYKVISWH